MTGEGREEGTEPKGKEKTDTGRYRRDAPTKAKKPLQDREGCRGLRQPTGLQALCPRSPGPHRSPSWP